MSRNSTISILAGALLASTGAGIAASAATAGPVSAVSATALPPSDSGRSFAHRGSVVSSSKLSVRSLVDAGAGFALASVGQAQYPANTTDGGKTWRIDGPHLHVNAANAPDVVSGSGVVGPRTYFAYGGPGGGNTVVVSTDAGKTWWRAYLPGVPMTVEPTNTGGKSALATIVESNAGHFLAYVSTDGGRHWKYDKSRI